MVVDSMMMGVYVFLGVILLSSLITYIISLIQLAKNKEWAWFVVTLITGAWVISLVRSIQRKQYVYFVFMLLIPLLYIVYVLTYGVKKKRGRK